MELRTAVMWPFTLAIMAMVLFLIVWCCQGLLRLRRLRQAGSAATLDFESDSRGRLLLRSWLSPAQLGCYEQNNYFDVVGSDSAAIYRIHHGIQANVEQLDSLGHPVCAWCFMPEGDLVAGDIMLAQKITLETDERAALAVAIRYETLRNRPVAWSQALHYVLR